MCFFRVAHTNVQTEEKKREKNVCDSVCFCALNSENGDVEKAWSQFKG